MVSAYEGIYKYKNKIVGRFNILAKSIDNAVEIMEERLDHLYDEADMKHVTIEIKPNSFS